ncbi:uncharacterized protein [Henckelia pumila]|uniref:uncharacterized protein n=1 Tax=Henckelia pumila TaxID=405737 RepID=UPI003C6DD3E3
MGKKSVFTDLSLSLPIILNSHTDKTQPRRSFLLAINEDYELSYYRSGSVSSPCLGCGLIHPNIPSNLMFKMDMKHCGVLKPSVNVTEFSSGDVQSVVNLRMNRNAFGRLCYLLTNIGGLVESRYVRVEEKVAMFLSTLAHHKKNRVTGHDYIRSGQTISAHFHEVMRALLKLHLLLLVKPAPVDESCTNENWKWFKGCLGALDGTHISVHVPARDMARYRTRKGTIAVNVLAVCDREMNFIYALTGWEGSAADARALRDALTRDDSFRVPRGCYYICDNGYENIEGFLTPYRKVRYHRDSWGNRATGPENYKDLFNWRHSRARNVIERAFGLLKKRWAILRSPSFYPIAVQNRIILGCILLHNFIRTQMPEDPVEDIEEDSVASPEENQEIDFISSFESSGIWDSRRDEFAMNMWNTDH